MKGHPAKMALLLIRQRLLSDEFSQRELFDDFSTIEVGIGFP